MFRNHYITIAAWIIVYISLWLSRDNLVLINFLKITVTQGLFHELLKQ